MATPASTRKKRIDNLYRYIGFERLCELFENRQLFFAHPTTWQTDDPYETVLKHDQSHRVFALSWCRESYSDAMWKIYCGDEKGVRIGTTVNRLWRELENAEVRGELRYRIGHVTYPLTMTSYRKQIAAAQKNFAGHKTITNAAKTLFFKRKAYRHECETRAVIKVNSENASDTGSGGYLLNIDPHKLVRSVLLHPRASSGTVELLTEEIRTRLGFKGSVKQSLLYTNPEADSK